MNEIIEILEKLRGDLKSELNGAVAETKDTLEARLATIDRLLQEGRLHEARLTAATFDSVLEETVSALSGKFHKLLLVDAKEEIKGHLREKAESALRQKVLGLLGGVLGAPIASLAIQLMRDLLRGYSIVDIREFLTPFNQDLLAEVIATATQVEKFHRERHTDKQSMRDFYKAMRPDRDKFLIKLLRSDLLEATTKKQVFQFQRQWHVITPGQRNLLQELVDKFATQQRQPDSNSASSTGASIFGNLGAGVAATSSSTLIADFGPEAVKGIQREYSPVWQSWFPEDEGPDTHLGHSIPQLLAKPSRTRFLARTTDS